MKPIKVFISQVMRDKTENEILCERNIAIDKIKRMFSDRSIVIIDSCKQRMDMPNIAIFPSFK